MIRCIDVETTGLPPDCAVCEIGWCDVVKKGAAWAVEPPLSALVNPERPIPPEASAVHHIIDADVADALPLASVIAGADLDRDDLIYCAHKADFERNILGWKDARWICTYKIALHLAPQAPAHNLQTLRYWLKLAGDPALMAAPHRAGPDAYITALMLARMLTKMSADEMIEVSSRPAVLPRFTFGKHAMKPLADVPSDYLEWMTRQADMDPDAKFTAAQHLASRQTQQAIQ